MSDKMRGLPFPDLCRHILNSPERVFGIPELLQRKKTPELCRTSFFGRTLDTPVGVAAGPHTQMAQNIISAWLCGARYIELKTVQVLDQLELSKPCIDMEDEGFNCEWSQELSLAESFHEYCNAWIICNYLAARSGKKQSAGRGFMFNFSIGYNLEGIMSDRMQDFIERIMGAGQYIKSKIDSVRDFFPELGNVSIDSCISDCVTLSTMHGCPPGEIEKIGLYLIREKGLNTIIKLNPTLAGRKNIKEILNNRNRFPVEVPSAAFAHDITMAQAKKIVANLKKAASRAGVHFAVKLSNTLESKNRKDVFSKAEKTVYMSGRPLHPVTVKAALELQRGFGGSLSISFSGGADAWNIARVAECGMVPVTVCSDILRPGGYARLGQYLDVLEKWIRSVKRESLSDYLQHLGHRAKLDSIEKYAADLETDPYYKKNTFVSKSIKVNRALPVYDCALAPCSFSCPAGQKVPDYVSDIRENKPDKALKTIYVDNPFPCTTGTVCDHVCQYKCTRQNIDYSVKIRDLKLYAAENAGMIPLPAKLPDAGAAEKKAAVIGAGPSGLSCAWFLRLAGWDVTVFEEASSAGGMVRRVIPSFRLDAGNLKKDIDRILAAGVTIKYGCKVNREIFEQAGNNYDAVYVAVGAAADMLPGIQGEKLSGVYGALDFLTMVKQDKGRKFPGRILVIGGGNSAMDAARAAIRMAGIEKPDVHLVYRRTLEQMPADREELEAVIREKVTVHELLSPLKIEKKGKHLLLHCQKMKLGPAAKRDRSGRRKVHPIHDKTEKIECSLIISAIGQQSDLSPAEGNTLTGVNEGISSARFYYGGDCLRGPSSIIRAIADGKQAAFQISADGGRDRDKKSTPVKSKRKDLYSEHYALLANRDFSEAEKEAGAALANSADGIDKSKYAEVSSFTAEQARAEALRCLGCSEVCNVCVSVCPNRALFAVENRGLSVPAYAWNSLKKKIEKQSDLRFNQRFQIFRIAEFCNECGNCRTFCPSGDSPYKLKPSICLNEQYYETEERGYFFGKDEIRFKNRNESRILWKEGDRFVYTDGKYTAEFSSSFKLLELNGIENQAVLEKPSELRMIFLLLQEAPVPGLPLDNTGGSIKKPSGIGFG